MREKSSLTSNFLPEVMTKPLQPRDQPHNRCSYLNRNTPSADIHSGQVSWLTDHHISPPSQSSHFSGIWAILSVHSCGGSSGL